MVVQLSSFQPTGQYGYACKVWIAREIEEKYLGGSYYVWLSEQLNPLVPTGLSSTPLEIYRVVDYAVKTNDTNHTKLKDLRATIRNAIYLFIAPTNPQLARTLRRKVGQASLDMFRPQLWRIDLSNIAAGRLLPGKPNWDEKLIKNLQRREFEVIVE